MELLPGDIVCTKGTGKLAKAIRFFTRRIGEPRSRVNHVGIIANSGPLWKVDITEALQHVVRRNFHDAYGPGYKGEVAIFRARNLVENERYIVSVTAERYVGRDYGYGKILAHFGDWGATNIRAALLPWIKGDVYLFRRLARMDNYPMCAWVVDHAYASVGENFGAKDPSPDDIWDFCNGHRDKYELIFPLGKLGDRL